jgi:hypothetical protein
MGFVTLARDVVSWWIFVFVSSPSPAGESPVRVAARRPGSRLAARGLETGRGRNPSRPVEAIRDGLEPIGRRRSALYGLERERSERYAKATDIFGAADTGGRPDQP